MIMVKTLFIATGCPAIMGKSHFIASGCPAKIAIRRKMLRFTSFRPIFVRISMRCDEYGRLAVWWSSGRPNIILKKRPTIIFTSGSQCPTIMYFVGPP